MLSDLYLVLANCIRSGAVRSLVPVIVSVTTMIHGEAGFSFGGERTRAFVALISRFFFSSSESTFFALGFFATAFFLSGFLTAFFFSGFFAGFFAGFWTGAFLAVDFAVAFLVVFTFVVMVAVAKDLAN